MIASGFPWKGIYPRPAGLWQGCFGEALCSLLVVSYKHPECKVSFDRSSKCNVRALLYLYTLYSYLHPCVSVQCIYTIMEEQ
jgi:hypothetical protein